MAVGERKYLRNRTGEVVHVEGGCAAAKKGIPWNWADGLTPREVARELQDRSWLRWCRRCGHFLFGDDPLSL